MLFSWLFQPLIRLVKRIHLKTSPSGLRVEGWHQGSTNAAFGSKMGFQTHSLGAGLSSLIPSSCNTLEWYSIFFFSFFFLSGNVQKHTYALPRLQQRTCDASFQLHGAPSSDCGLRECVEKEPASAITCIILMLREAHGPALASLHFRSQPNRHTRVIRLLWGKMTALFALICKSVHYISAFNVLHLTMHTCSSAGKITALRMPISRLVGSNHAGAVGSSKQHGPI